MADPQDVTVNIFGNRYTLRADGDPQRVVDLAEEVDARMREAAAEGGALGADRIAVLVALNLADDLARERRARHEDREDLSARTGRILEILNDEVGSEGAGGV
jgi:cell division protein ZapA